MDPLRLYVVFDPAFEAGSRWADFLSTAFDCVGMNREGQAFSVPVHRRSCPWGAPQPGLDDPRHPRRIALDAARRNVILVLYDPVMHDKRQQWSQYLDHLNAQATTRKGLDLFIPVQLTSHPLALMALKQTIKPGEGNILNDKRVRTRFLVRLLNAVLVDRDPVDREDATGPGHTIFVSHAKRDGRIVAQRIVALIKKVNEGLGPRCFFDADSLLPGAEYPQHFEAAIAHGSLLALVTDAYHSRPWCRWEVLTAKRLGRAVVAADLTDARIERTFPYLGNVPSIRVRPSADELEGISDAAIEELTLALLAESMRVELWRERAESALQGRSALFCARPPELSDLVVLSATLSKEHLTLLLYPDPPLTNEETELLQQGFPNVSVRTLSQIAE